MKLNLDHLTLCYKSLNLLYHRWRNKFSRFQFISANNYMEIRDYYFHQNNCIIAKNGVWRLI